MSQYSFLKQGRLMFSMICLFAGTTLAANGNNIHAVRSNKTARATFVTPADGGEIPVAASRAGQPADAWDFIEQHGAVFGVKKPDKELAFQKQHQDMLGFTHTSYKQLFKGVPVFAGTLRVHQNAKGKFKSANGAFFPIPEKLSTVPNVTAQKAEETAIAALNRGKPWAVHSELVVVDPGWYGDPARGARLAYYLIMIDPFEIIREGFFIDAKSGEILDQWNMIDNARSRLIYNANETSTVPGTLARSEGEAAGSDTDVNRAYDYAGDVYDYFYRAFGRDSIDSAGMDLIVSVHSTAPGCPNAYWDGSEMVFCTDTITDDIMAHEMAHGITEHTAALIYQNQPGQLNESFSDVFGEMVDLFNGDAAFAGTPDSTISWPTHATGSGLDTPNNLRTGCSTSYPSYPNGVRWLMGEDAAAFGGALRDLWDPTCYGNPDRANSPLQTCNSEDYGGVHSGCGVPCHAFAIVTDGKTFNGYTVTGIGPIKSAAVWYRALTTYLVSASDFKDAYYALKQAATDLVGTYPNDPRTGAPSDSMFTADDAIQVENACLATEMNTDGACGATVDLLDSNPPILCSPRTDLFFDDFESGTAGWTFSTSPTPPTSYEWEVTTDALPAGRAGHALFGADMAVGDCGSQDESAVHSAISPVINMPSGTLVSPTLIFTHRFSTETSYDGGNVKIKVNDGAWTILPASAFTYNPYNSTLESTGNTNPLAGQPAFTGSTVPWGTSVVDLSSYVSGGQSIQISFDLGKDGCTGDDGWYIDDVAVYVCSTYGPIPVAHDSTAATTTITPINITLQATDDGLPDPPAALTYTIAALPSQGTLSDPQAGTITTVPYTLAAYGNQVIYIAIPDYTGTDTFSFFANDGGTSPTGGDSNLATITVTVNPPAPPLANDGAASTNSSTVADITLVATDDGYPNPPAALTCIITSLPTAGSLSDPGAGAIDSVPYVLVSGGNHVFYTPTTGYVGSDSFTFLANDGGTAPDGGDSNIATIQLTISASGPYYTEQFTGTGDAFDLANTSILFIPGGAAGYHTCLSSITAFPTDPTGGTDIGAGDDTSTQITLSEATISLYGTAYNTFYIGSNGYITFDAADTDFSETLAKHFAQKRIAGAFDDLNPPSGGSISWRQLADRVAVTWLNVPEYGSNAAYNNFQIEMFFDGRICISWLSGGSVDAIVGLSRGSALPDDFAETDLSALSCDTTPPTLAAAVSQMAHGSAGDMDINVLTTGAIECRKNGPTQLVVTFNEPIVAATDTAADISLTTGTCSSIALAGTVLTIELSGVADRSYLQVGFPGISDLLGNAVTQSLCFGVLSGDSSRSDGGAPDGVVNIYDLLAVKNAIDRTANSTNFRSDVSSIGGGGPDGVVNIFDLIAIKNNFDRTLTGSCP